MIGFIGTAPQSACNERLLTDANVAALGVLAAGACKHPHFQLTFAYNKPLLLTLAGQWAHIVGQQLSCSRFLLTL
jgi:hypothetical protein